MAQPRRRLDPYGTPIPPLRDAREAEPLADTATNREQVALLWTRLEALLHEALQRGWSGEVSLTLYIQDGTIHDHGVERLRRRR